MESLVRESFFVPKIFEKIEKTFLKSQKPCEFIS